MNCTLITGPERSDKTALIKWILCPHPEDAICYLKPLKSGPDKEKTISKFEQVLSPECRLVVVDEIQDLSMLQFWLQLSRGYGFLSAMAGQSTQVVRPDIVLIFESEKPVIELLTSEDTRGIKIIDFTCLPVVEI